MHLAEWRKNRKAPDKIPDPATDAKQRARIRKLERKNRELELVNEILKDAPIFFAKDRKN